MRCSAFAAMICLGLAACGSTPTEESPYLKPNQLMEQEINDRISQIPFQQREELFNNLLWLSQTGEQAIPALLQALQHQNPKVRSNCLWVLGRMRDRRTIPDIQPLVNDPDETVCLEAARTLVTMGDLKHVPILVAGLDSNKLQVRYLCHEALKQSTGRSFGYDHRDDDIDDRRQAAYRWRKWWADQAGDPWFAKDYAADYGIDVYEAENRWLTGSTPAPLGESVDVSPEQPLPEDQTPPQDGSAPLPDATPMPEDEMPLDEPRNDEPDPGIIQTTPVESSQEPAPQAPQSGVADPFRPGGSR